MSIVPKVALALSISVAALSAPLAPAAAAQEQRQSYDLPAQPLAQSLREVSMRSGRSIAAPADLLRGRIAPAVRGSYTPPEVIETLLAGSGLIARRVGDGLLIERIQSSDGGSGGQGAPSDEIIVTGTRIRGATPVGSNLVTLDRKDIDRSGYATTQQILAALPQNFAGGANEGTVGFSVRNNSSTNFGFGSGINLRGLGTTSTLTLVDGNRPPLGGGAGNGRISKCGDRLTRKLLFEAANVMLSRTSQASALKDWAAAIGRRSGFWKARVALARKLAVILHRMWIDGRGFDPKVTAMA
ncbi:outer membrane receptor protein involved in Fe transport [Sphingomonas sp. JUb134]|nr:outer membrane receptor protein involved in Fe transport [Sphingomonas sp. JUb134]